MLRGKSGEREKREREKRGEWERGGKDRNFVRKGKDRMMLHHFLWVLLSACVTPATPAAPGGTLWGAIRWDAFVNSTTSPSDPGVITARVLTPEVWHDRLPWFSYIDPQSGNVTFDERSPSVMAAEIEMAVAAGIDHWAFDVYPPESDLSSALYAYLNSSSPAKASLFFCLLLQSSWMSSGGLPAWPAKVALYAAHFARAEYRTVLDNRPLVYLFAVEEGAFGGTGWEGWAEALTALEQASLAAGRGAPYIVIQCWSAAQGLAQLKGINAAGGAPLVAALSSYALLGATEEGTPFADFARGGVGFWDSLAATGVDVIPPVAAGWDPRPRNMTPVPWAPYQDPAYVVMPTPTELGDFVQSALDWTAQHLKSNPTRCHLLSAWNVRPSSLTPSLFLCVWGALPPLTKQNNLPTTPPFPRQEYDEGHFISAVLPQFGGNARLSAIGRVLRP